MELMGRRLRPKASMDMAERLPEHIILHHILSALDYTSWLRFAAVNRAWRRISADSSPPPLGIPSIAVSDYALHCRTIPPPSTATSPHLPSATGFGSPVGSFQHYLLLSFRAGPKKVHVVNAITGRSFRIPSPPRSFIDAAAFYTHESSHKSDEISDWIAALAEFDCGVVHVYGAGRWTRKLQLPGFQKVHDLIFHKGRLFCVTRDGEIVVFDVSGYCPSTSDPLQPVVVIPKRPIKSVLPNFNLVESCSGELLLVVRHHLAPSDIGGPYTLTVHRVDEEQGALVRLRDLGEQMLFVGVGCSRSVLYGSVRPRPSQFFTPNSIYFFFCHSLVGNELLSGLGKFSMNEDGSSNVVALHHRHPLPVSLGEPVWISKA